jgi:NO-binding membrane sensor protein with MHYT domain
MMYSQVVQVFDCVRHNHDLWLVLLAGLVCLCGIYASFALAAHAVRSGRKTRRPWGPVSIVSAGCTAWATHFIILLALKPGMPSALDPLAVRPFYGRSLM